MPCGAYVCVHVCVCVRIHAGELKEPLLTFQLYEDFTALASDGNADTRIATLAKLITALPPRNAAVLEYLLVFLRSVADHAEVNKMGTSNLAIVFGPNLLWSPDVALSFSDTGKINQVARYLLEADPVQIFGSD
eukprot:m.677320 g.677320  ORF g.677320 m.677320 type:complete len:134 (+) comp22795_c0_seq10:1318-1719(+)